MPTILRELKHYFRIIAIVGLPEEYTRTGAVMATWARLSQDARFRCNFHLTWEWQICSETKLASDELESPNLMTGARKSWDFAQILGHCGRWQLAG